MKCFYKININHIIITTFFKSVIIKMNTDDCKITDCPICMDVIEGNKNCVTTDCGHKFHTNCLMKSVAHNGFGCPYCRTVMAEEVDEEETIYTDDNDDDDYEDETELYDDYALRGLRFLTNNLNGEEHDPQDIEDEAEDNLPKPSTAFIQQKLVEQGVTMEDLLKVILIEHEDYTDRHYELDQFVKIDRDVYEKLRLIITNYTPEQVL